MYVESFTFDTQLFSLAIMHSLERAEHKIPLILPVCSGFWWRTGGHFDICNAFYLVLPYPILSRTSAYFVKFVVPW